MAEELGADMNRRDVLLGLGSATALAPALQTSADRNERMLPLEKRAAPAQPALRYAHPILKTISVQQIPIGGTGFVTGIDVSSDGLAMVCRTDVGNGYFRNSADVRWKPLFSALTLGIASDSELPGEGKDADGRGVSGVAIAPSNKQVIYAGFLGHIWKSVDAGRSIQRTAFRQRRMLSNSGWQRIFNSPIAVHPFDSEVVAVGTWDDGNYLTQDGGRSWRLLSLDQPGKSLDDHPGITLFSWTNDTSPKLVAFVTGKGLFKANDWFEFSKVQGGPVHCSHLQSGQSGEILLCEHSRDNRGRVWRLTQEQGWSSVFVGQELHTIAINPFDRQHVIGSSAYGLFFVSRDGGQSFRQCAGPEWSAGEVAWTNNLTRILPAQLVFDPKHSGRFWIAQGVGVACGSEINRRVHVSDRSAGIEELCVSSIITTPRGDTVAAAWDKPFWHLATDQGYHNDFRYPVAKGQRPHADLVQFATSLDVALDDPAFLAGLVAPNEGTGPGYSLDGGKNWQVFDGKPSASWGIGGCLAISDKKNIVLLPSNNGFGTYTLDGGATWSSLRLDGRSPTANFANAYYVARRNIAADKTRKGVFALVYTVMHGNGYGNPLGGVWRTSDGGSTWEQVRKGVIDVGDGDPIRIRDLGLEERQFWACQLEYIPGRPGELLYTAHADKGDDRLFWSRDDGATWSEPRSDIRNVICFTFGFPIKPGAPPAVYFWGKVGQDVGLFVSVDWFKSKPVLLTQVTPLLGKPTTMASSQRRFGEVHVGTSCTGVFRVNVG